MEEEFRAILLANSGLSALAPTGVHWLARPQGAAYPVVVLTLISEQTGYTYTGPDELQRARVQVDCYALTYAGAKALSRAVLAALSGYRGGRFQGIFHDLTRETREGAANEAERPFRVQHDFLTNWR
jgi:hypothetical protein